MKKILLLFAVIAFIGCEKEDTRPDCEINSYGTMDVINNSDEVICFYVDGTLVREIPPRNQLDGHQLTTGSHTIRIEQWCNLIDNAVILFFDGTVASCERKFVSYPQ